jgi:hypothetical protein
MIAQLLEASCLVARISVRDGLDVGTFSTGAQARSVMLDKRRRLPPATGVVGAVGGAGAGRLRAKKQPAGPSARTHGAAHGDGAYPPVRRQLTN